MRLLDRTSRIRLTLSLVGGCYALVIQTMLSSTKAWHPAAYDTMHGERGLADRFAWIGYANVKLKEHGPMEVVLEYCAL